MYTRQRNRFNALKGPISVRTNVQQLDEEHHDVLVEDNKVIVGDKTVPNIWLRDNCQCSSCMHESTKQRLQDTFAIPKDLSIKSATVVQADRLCKKRLYVEWSDGHMSMYTQPFLASAATSFERRSIMRQGLIQPNLWDSSIASDPPRVTYQNAMNNQVGTVLQKIVSDSIL